jgi:competence protein ComEA
LTLLLIQYAWQRLGFPGRPTSLADADRPTVIYRLDLNNVSQAELQQLPGVGPGLASRIVEHREQHGPFRDVTALRQVHGIGPVLWERLGPQLQVRGTVAPTEAGQSLPLGTKASGTRKPVPTQLIDLNQARREDLMQLPSIGPVLADRILADRADNGPYQQVTDITRVKGIKAKILEKIRPYLCDIEK